MAFKLMLFSSLVLTASAATAVNFPSYGSNQGTLCQLPDKTVSKCALITECPSALKALKLRQPLPLRCGFKGHIEIVCCPDLRVTSNKPVIASTTERNSIRRRSPVKVGARSAEACQKFTKNAYPRIALFITNGVEAGLGEFPHMVLLGYPPNKEILNTGPTLTRGTNASWTCCGTLISEKFVLTAAHCVEKTDPFLVRIGDLDWATDDDGAQPKEFRVKKVTSHPEFRLSTLDNDIALLELRTPVPFNWLMQPACLPPPGENEDSSGQSVLVSGWGDTEFGSSKASTMLMKANLGLVPFSLCNVTYSTQMRKGLQLDKQMCAGDTKGRMDSCQGDSGGPLQAKPTASNVYKVLGIVSTGFGCGGSKPGLYTRVSGYIDWIEEIVWPTKNSIQANFK
jgi:secreted trypsin-like serine protease